jgi:hypothetical protein
MQTSIYSVPGGDPMSTQYRPLNEPPADSNNPDAAYQWFLANHDEIMAISKEIDFLAQLKEIESETDLPPGTAERFATIHADASSVPEQEESRFMAAWDAYHEALDADPNLATLARLYGERVRMPIYDRINAEGTFIF